MMTTPFGFEGRRRLQEAARGQGDLAAVCATLILPSDRSSDIVGSQATLRRALDCRDEAVCAAARAIVEGVMVQGRTCLGFADIHAIFQNRGSGAVGIGAATGLHRAERAAENARSCPFLRDLDLTGAAGVFAQVAAGTLGTGEIERVARTLWRAIGDDVAMIVGDAADQHLGDTLRVTLVAAGAAGRQS
jgi:cell division protein FtsZ